MGTNDALELDRVGIGDGLPTRGVPRVVDENVNVTEVGDRGADHRLALGMVVDRSRVRGGAPSECFDLGDRSARGVLVAAVVDRDVGAVFGETERYRLPDSAAAAGDQRNATFERHSVPPAPAIRR